MIIIKPVVKQNEMTKSTHSAWISYSDMMAALMLLFVLVLTYSLYQYFTLLELKLTAPDTAQAASETLADEEAEAQAAAATEIPPAVTKAPATPTQAPVQTPAPATQAPVVKEEAVPAVTAAPQKTAAELVDVRTSIISDLGTSLSDADLKVVIDKSTGDIMLESEVFFDYNSNTIKKSGQEFLLEFIPMYINVLLDPQYSDYVGEIIIEGHTDTNGAYLYNLELSQNRALAVAKFCLEKTDLTEDQLGKLQNILAAKGCSSSNPILNDDGSVDQDASRRVEFKFRLKDADMLDELSAALDTGE